MTSRDPGKAKAEQLNRAYFAMRHAMEALSDETKVRENALIYAREEISRTLVFLRKNP